MSCSGVSQDDKDRNTCQEMRVESSRAGHGRLFWRLSLWTAPWCQPPTPPPHHWLSRATSPSEDVMSGPGWQESWPGGATSLWSVSLLFTPLPFYSVFLNLSACFSLTPPSLLLFSLPFPPTLHLILVSYLSICLPLNISDLSVLSLSPLSLNPQLSLSPLSWTPWPVVFVYITPDHQVRLSKYHHKN